MAQEGGRAAVAPLVSPSRVTGTPGTFPKASAPTRTWRSHQSPFTGRHSRGGPSSHPEDTHGHRSQENWQPELPIPRRTWRELGRLFTSLQTFCRANSCGFPSQLLQIIRAPRFVPVPTGACPWRVPLHAWPRGTLPEPPHILPSFSFILKDLGGTSTAELRLGWGADVRAQLDACPDVQAGGDAGGDGLPSRGFSEAAITPGTPAGVAALPQDVWSCTCMHTRM